MKMTICNNNHINNDNINNNNINSNVKIMLLM